MKFKKGSAAAKAYMAKLRAAKGKTKKVGTIKKIGALPIDFKGSFLGYSFSIVNQYTIDGGVTAVFLDKEKVKIVELNGFKDEEKRAIDILTSRAKANFSAENGRSLDNKDIIELNKRVTKFIQQLNKEVKDYNTGKDRHVKKAKPVKLVYKPSTKKLSLINEIKTLLKNDKKILVRGYKLKSGKLRDKKISGVKKSPARSLHKDTKSHNVNIRVMSGVQNLNEYWLKNLQDYIKVLKEKENLYKWHFDMSKKKTRSLELRKSDKSLLPKLKQQINNLKYDMKQIKSYIK
jgi:hypothetical protein